MTSGIPVREGDKNTTFFARLYPMACILAAVAGRQISVGDFGRVALRIAVAVAGWVFLTTPAGAQSLDAALARLDKSAQQFHAVTADIQRNVHTAIVNDDSKESGE